MRKFMLAMAALAISVSALAVGKAEAMPLGAGSAVGQAADELNSVEQTQFIYGGRQYCWYPDGWQGPGFYWCGYHLRRGFGWGGPMGWRGWSHGGPRIHRGGPRRGPAIIVGPRGGVGIVGPRGGRVIHRGGPGRRR